MSRKLLDVERQGGVTKKTWHHDDSKITVQTTQDVDPLFKSVKERTEAENPKGTFRLKAEVPFTLIEETCKREAERSGARLHELVSEVVTGHTDRAKRIWKMLSEERDFNRLHAKTYR